GQAQPASSNLASTEENRTIPFGDFLAIVSVAPAAALSPPILQTTAGPLNLLAREVLPASPAAEQVPVPALLPFAMHRTSASSKMIDCFFADSDKEVPLTEFSSLANR